MKFPMIVSLTIFLFACTSKEERILTPPIIDPSTIGEKIVCCRPYRDGGPRVEYERKSLKHIIHNYGHGGSGWTLGPGTVDHAIQIFESSMHPTKNIKIAIVGAGIIGCLTAYKLSQQGYTNINIYAQHYNGTTSHNAGAVISPIAIGHLPEKQIEIDGYVADSYKFYETLQEDHHYGIRKLPFYFDNREKSNLENLVAKSLIKPAQDVLVHFGQKTYEMVEYQDGMYIDTEYFLQYIKNTLKSKVRFYRKTIKSFNNIKEKIIFNCTGIKAEKICKDKKMKALTGHLIILKNQANKQLNYLIITQQNVEITPNGCVSRVVHFFPKTHGDNFGVLGGTFIQNIKNNSTHREEFDKLIKRSKEMFHNR